MGLFIEKKQERKRVYEKNYSHTFRYFDMPSAGFSFDCDAQGNLLRTDCMSQLGWDNLMDCFSEENPLEVEYMGLTCYETSYMQPSISICKHCSGDVYLDDPMDNDCEGCGAIYNMSGQEVRCHARDVDYLDAGEVW